jgi:hypothetical protein
MTSKQRVESFDLSDLDQKKKYEQIINTYQVIREEFAYVMKNGVPVITVWYILEED